MSDERYQVCFNGTIDPKFQVDQVKPQIAKMFNANDQQLAAFFSGKKVVIKTNLDLPTGKKYYAALAKVGALCTVESMTTGLPIELSVKPAPQPSSATAKAESTTAKPAPKPPAPASPEARSTSSSTNDSPWSRQVEKSTPDWQVAAAGSTLESLPRHAAPVNPDISGISLAEVGTTLSETSKKKQVADVDISHLSMSPPD